MISFVDGATDGGIYFPVTIFVSITSLGLVRSSIFSSPASILAGSTFFPFIVIVIVVVGSSSLTRPLSLATRVAIYIFFQGSSSDRILDGTLQLPAF